HTVPLATTSTTTYTSGSLSPTTTTTTTTTSGSTTDGTTTTIPGTLQSVNVVETGAPQVWSNFNDQGAGVSVAVLDSGIIASPDLPNAVFGVDLINHGLGL